MTTGCSSRPGYYVASCWHGHAVAKHAKQKYILNSFTDMYVYVYCIFVCTVCVLYIHALFV